MKLENSCRYEESYMTLEKFIQLLPASLGKNVLYKIIIESRS